MITLQKQNNIHKSLRMLFNVTSPMLSFNRREIEKEIRIHKKSNHSNPQIVLHH